MALHEDHAQTYQNVREASDESGHGAAFADLQGPKIRLGSFADGSTTLTRDQALTITTRDVLGNRDLVPTTYAGLPNDVWLRTPSRSTTAASDCGLRGSRAPRGAHQGDRPRSGQRSQGDQPARCSGHRASCTSAKDEDDLRFALG
ncbi:MAG: pyruvate kinase [Nocardioidaceae bacterium]